MSPTEINEAGQAINFWTLDSDMTRGHSLLRQDTPASWPARSQTDERINAPDPRQMRLPGF